MPDPFDPVKGAWWLLIIFAGTLALNTAFRFAGCVMQVPGACTREGAESLAQLGMELLTATAVLIAAGKK